MEPINRGLISLVLAMSIAPAAFAQDRQPDQRPSGRETVAPADGASLTGKERMGRKWMDEQRIDNCNVPIDKRGTKPRPGNCLHLPSS
jgi:hypothetical protein